ncbi:septum formation protein Maf [bacterium]|nr:septum formation protein Maf [bacterium]
MILLASTSPRRRTILKSLGLKFRVVKSLYREIDRRSQNPSRLALRHAIGKAQMARVRRKCGVVLGADTVVSIDGRILGKPRNLREAFRMLKLLSGRIHTVHTGVALIDLASGRSATGTARTRVTFKRLDTGAIRRYLARIHPLDKAAAYAIQDGKDVIKSIRGSFTNVMGLPAELLKKLLQKLGK